MKFVHFSTLVMTMLLFFGCAASYKQMELDKLDFRNTQVSNNVEFSYRYDVLSFFGNNRYASYEKDENINIVALKIKNNTGHDISINDNTFKVYTGTNQLQILEPETVIKEMHQNTYPYFFYSLLFLNIINGESVTPIPIGIPIAFINFLRANGANNNFEEDLVKYNVINKEIKKGEPFIGIIPLYNAKYDPLRFEFVEQLAEKQVKEEESKGLIQLNNAEAEVQKSSSDTLEVKSSQ